MKDTSKLVTFLAIIGLAVALSTLGPGLPNLDGIGHSLFWVLGAILVFNLIYRGGCCGGRARYKADAAEDDSPAEPE